MAVENAENLFRVIRGAFAKRRKTLSNSLSGETNKLSKALLKETREKEASKNG